MNKTLILGGIKSGKSRLAEKLALASQLPVTYIATAQPHDAEMEARIQQHQQQRPASWQTVETTVLLSAALDAHCQDQHCVLVDCLTLWLTNLLMTNNQDLITTEINNLLTTLPRLPGTIIMVSNETSMGVVPLGELSRRFCDEAGLLHQQLAEICDRAILTVAGLPHFLKGSMYERI